MFRPDLRSRRALLAALKGEVLADGVLPPGDGPRAFCSDPKGRDTILTPLEILELSCADCKKLCVLAARRVIDARTARIVELCCTVSDDPEEHVFLRIDGTIRDPAQEAGMPPRRVGDYIAETVWKA